MSEMIERVAKAIFDVVNDGDVVGVEMLRAEMAARAAIEAMREPDEEMTFLGNELADDYDKPAQDIYRAMINAALTPPPDMQSAASDKARSPKPA